jgi:outer membrane protein assembly factor BamB
MVAISTSNCLSFQVAWHATFGPDSFAYPNANPRSAPTATAGGVVFMGTACTPDSTNTICTTPSASNEQGAVWAVNAANGTVLNGGNPVLITGGPVKMAPVVDGDNVYVVDNNGELYGLSIDSDLQLSKAERQSIVTARRRPVAQRALDWR